MRELCLAAAVLCVSGGGSCWGGDDAASNAPKHDAAKIMRDVLCASNLGSMQICFGSGTAQHGDCPLVNGARGGWPNCHD